MGNVKQEAYREGEKKKTTLEGLGRPNLLNIALCELESPCLHPWPFCLRLGGRTFAPSIHRPCSMRVHAMTKETS